MGIQLKRAYDDADESDGYRLLVDRLWPRGVSKEELQHDDWLKEIAPSGELRKWFDHDPDKFAGFKEKYFKELDQKPWLIDDLLERIHAGQTLTLIYSAKDKKRNNAAVLKEYLEKRLG